MAQAVTFRAFGAENPSVDTTCVARVISIQSRFAEVERPLQQSRGGLLARVAIDERGLFIGRLEFLAVQSLMLS